MFITSEEKSARLRSSLNLALFTGQTENLDTVEVCSESAQEICTPGPSVDSPEPADSEQMDGENREKTLTIVPHHFRGRTKGATNIPDFLRPIIGASAHLSSVKETAEAFNISTDAVYNLKNGLVHNGEQRVQNKENKSKVEVLINQAQETAADRLMSALGFMDDDKLKNLGAEKLSRVAADMSRVIEKTTEKKNYVGAQIIIMAPTQKPEDKYDVIDIKD